jgi:RNAse (barnase) inhibitor barstar
LIVIDNIDNFLKEVSGPYYFFTFKFRNPQKNFFVETLSKEFTKNKYTTSNWDSLIDIMRGFHKFEVQNIVILVETDNIDSKVFKDFDEVVDFVNEFLKNFSKKIIFVLKPI